MRLLTFLLALGYIGFCSSACFAPNLRKWKLINSDLPRSVVALRRPFRSVLIILRKSVL